ncbi:hypothetical protein HIM_11586 [Hirsutella minnesotensis 3608]|uniref:DNA 3'-5' helicase n=1 Tax=Hirsutella minnesotensis 3608 TaxID=1043627 RepID=A0A0F7ZWI4_9HYPO|nr:hypothetical protein HIM_11586 [Hirsutella minnesotensis 3608]
MQKHCRNEHGWVNDWKRGGNVVQRARQERVPMPWRRGVSCQRISKWGHGNRWFEVGRFGNGDSQQARDGGFDEVAEFFHRIHRDDEEAFESEVKARVQSIDDKWEAQTWLNRCGWSRHLDGIDRGRLRDIVRSIGEDEPVLQRMWEIFERVLNSAYVAASGCHAGTAELFEIERKEVHITTTMPFQGLMEPDAWARYKAWWKTLLSIWKRMESWESQSPGVIVMQEEGESSDSEESTEASVTDEDTQTGTSDGGSNRDRRPPYRMTIAQERLWRQFDQGVAKVVDEAGAGGRCNDEHLERCCLDTVVQFFDHPFKSGNHYESIIISALAVMGLDEKGKWMPATNYTPIYSAVIKVARYLVLYQSIVEREARIRVREQGMGIDRRTAEEATEGLFRIVRRKVRRFMTRISEEEDAEPTPMNWIINTRTYGMKIRYTTPGSETIDWRGDQIVHGRVKLRMSELSDMMHSLVAEARRTLARLTLTDDEDEKEEAKRDYAHPAAMQEMLPRIPWSKIEDQHGESELEHSFLRHEENEWWTQPGRGWIKDRILASAGRRKAWLAEPLDERCPYREHAVRGYERAVERFREQVFLAIHMLGGQPARSSEILGLRIWNTANAGVRNIFIHEGMVCFVTMYHKGFRKTGKAKVIHRYLPREVGELLVWYMWLVLPFWQNVQGRIKQKRRRSAFLWADEVVSAGGGRERRVREVMGVAGAPEGDGDQEEREEEAAFMEWFREPKWTGDRARRVMQRYSAQFSGQELNISAWRQIAIGISNRFFNKVFGADDGGDGDFDEDGNGNLVDSIYDLQAGHGSHVAGLIYARLFGQGELGTMRSREQFRKVSMQWHRFFGFGAEDRTERGCGASGGGGKRARAVFDVEREESQRKRFERLHRIDIRGQLKQMMGPTAEFRGMQETAIRAVTRGEWPIIQVTPTGGGKSLTFMLPAFCTPDGVTVVITPLTSLQHDMVARCAKSGISAYAWRSRGAQRAASLVFVTPESAVGKGFRTFVERMHGQHKMDRVVVDECHTILQHTKVFRWQMGKLGRTLRDFAVPVVCLTATLKPTQEAALIEKLEFVRDRVRIIREPTTRTNIRYRVDMVEDEGGRAAGAREGMNVGRKRGAVRIRFNGEGEEVGEKDDAIVERVCEIVRGWTAAHEQGKVIVYGGTIERVKQVAAELGCRGYWREAGGEEEKARWLAEWREVKGGEAGWIAATNALGMGIDNPNVRMVVHAGIPRQLVDFVQESGRGGRDGSKSESVVVIRRSWLRQQSVAIATQPTGGERDKWGRRSRRGAREMNVGGTKTWWSSRRASVAGERCWTGRWTGA